MCVLLCMKSNILHGARHRFKYATALSKKGTKKMEQKKANKNINKPTGGRAYSWFYVYDAIRTRAREIAYAIYFFFL